MTWAISEEVGKSQRYKFVIVTRTKDERIQDRRQDKWKTEDKPWPSTAALSNPYIHHSNQSNLGLIESTFYYSITQFVTHGNHCIPVTSILSS